MARLTAKTGPMRLVQCDGFSLYAGAGPQKSRESARRRLAPAARPGARAASRPPAVSTNHGATEFRRPAAWGVAVHSMVLASIVMGLFGAYALGQYAALSGRQSDLIYARPSVPHPYLR